MCCCERALHNLNGSAIQNQARINYFRMPRVCKTTCNSQCSKRQRMFQLIPHVEYIRYICNGYESHRCCKQNAAGKYALHDGDAEKCGLFQALITHEVQILSICLKLIVIVILILIVFISCISGFCFLNDFLNAYVVYRTDKHRQIKYSSIVTKCHELLIIVLMTILIDSGNSSFYY